uniref:60S acidic ribosomal protein P2 n=1 Tax=Pelagomonas calceolata TaxID=35677 RepID=A0A6S8V2J5_9STRA
MKYVSTYLMLVMGGNDSPSAADVTAALEKVGVDVDAADLKRFLAGVEGKDLAELMAAGKEKLAKFGGGGGGSGGGGDAAEEKEEEKKEEEEEEEIDMAGGMDMFGGEGGGDDY